MFQVIQKNLSLEQRAFVYESMKEQFKNIIKNEIVFVNSNCRNPFNEYTIDEELIWIDGVSSEHMDFMCTSIYDLSQKYHD